jgi:hypothetical protein
MDNNVTMPPPFPLDGAVNSTADNKNAELCAEESTPTTEKTLANTEISDKEFHIVATRKGYVRKDKEKKMWEILMLISWITWFSMSIAFTLRFMVACTATGSWIWSWTTFIPYIYEVATGFTTVVLGQATKLLNKWYENKQKEKGLPLD